MFGETGWTIKIPKQNSIDILFKDNEINVLQNAEDNNINQLPIDSKTEKFVTPSDFYCNRLQVRDSPNLTFIDQDVLLFGNQLFQRYCCDSYAKVEEQRLRYIWHHQKDFKYDTI